MPTTNHYGIHVFPNDGLRLRNGTIIDGSGVGSSFMDGSVIEADLVADGVTDDKTALNAAWDEARALPKGGIVQLPAGTIYLSTKWRPTAPGTGKTVVLRGAGRDATIIKFDTTVANNSYIISFNGTSASNRYLGSVHLCDFSFDNSAWGLDGAQRTNSGTVAAVTSSTVTLGSAAGGTNAYYDGCTFCIVEDTGNPDAVGQLFGMTTATYVGATKVFTVGSWGAGRQPTTSAKYGILMNGGDADDQVTRGCGRILFNFCDRVSVHNLGTYGGHGWIDIRGSNYGVATNLYAKWVQENAFNWLGGTDEVTDPNPRYWYVNGVVFEDVGEGFDCAVDDAEISNVTARMLGSDDECFDLNSSHRVTITNAVVEGGETTVNLHGVTYDNDNGYGSPSDIRISNVVGYDFHGYGLSVLFGTGAYKWRVELGAPTAGTFTLTIGGNTTGAIAYNAAASAVETALELLGSVVAMGGATVTGNDGTASGTSPYLVVFNDSVGGALTGSGAGLTNGTFNIYNYLQSVCADQVHNIYVDNCSFISSVSGAVGISPSWVNTSYPVRIGEMRIDKCYVEVPGAAIDCRFNKDLTVTDSTLISTGSMAVHGQSSAHRSEDVKFVRCKFKGVASSTTTGVVDIVRQIRPKIISCEWPVGQGQGYAVRFLETESPELLDCDIYDASGHAIYFDWSTSTYVPLDLDLKARCENNRLHQFGTQASGRFGITFTTSSGSAPALNCTGATIKNNYVNATTSYDVTTGGASSGTFTLTFNSATTTAIPYNATVAQVQSALDNLGTIGWGSIYGRNVYVKGATGGPWYIWFTGSLYDTANALTGSGAGLTGGSFAVTTHTASRGYSLSWTASQTLDVNFTGNIATDNLSATQKAVFSNIADTSRLDGNKFGSTYGGGFTVSVGDWYQVNVPQSQSATEATWSMCQPMSTRANTAQAGAAGTITLDAGASAIDDEYNGWLCITTGGTGANQTRPITDYVGSTKVATISPNWGTNPDNTTTFVVYRPSVNEAFFSQKRWIARKPGSIVRVWVTTSASVSAGTLTVTCYKNGGTTAFAATITTGTSGYAIQPSGQDTFVQGDALSMYITTDGSFSPATLEVRCGFDVEY